MPRKPPDNRVGRMLSGIPSGYLIGRLERGEGKAHLIGPDELRRFLGPGYIQAVASGGGGSTITVQEEGVTTSSTVTTLNLTGTGVTASGSGATATINIPGLIAKDEGTPLVDPVLSLNFVGDGISATNSGGNVTVTVSGAAAYSDEQAQDAVGSILVDSATINFTYNDGVPSITADVVGSGVAADYSAEVLADTPTAYWKCNEASGNILDYGGGGFNLTTITNVEYQNSPLLAGESDRYLRFTNTNSGAKLTSGLGLSYPLSGDLTVEAIVMPGSLGLCSWFGIDGGASELEINNSQIELRMNSSTQSPGVRWENSTGTENTANSQLATVRIGSVYHIVVVRDATAKTAAIYVNVRFQTSVQSYTNNPTGGTGTMVTYIGATGETTTNNSSVIGHVALYSGQKLSAARIFAHALAAGLTGSC